MVVKGGNKMEKEDKVSNLGVGVMLGMLSGNEETVKAGKDAVGKEIAHAAVVLGADAGHYGDTDKLVLTFTDKSALEIWDDGQSCCEHRFMHTDDELGDFVGATFLDAEVRDGPAEDMEYGEKESQFLVISTSIGQFTVVNYNEHNGYYGGFWLQARTRAER
jgi:hypothetical protein